MAEALPDLLAPGLRIVFCGKPDKRFWEMLFVTGLTPRQLEPDEWQSLLEYRIGLTDIAQDGAVTDRDSKGAGARELRRKIREFAPGMLVFNGKQPAKDYLDMPTVVYGLLPHSIGTTKLFVCPSTSGTRSSWDPRWWEMMAKLA